MSDSQSENNDHLKELTSAIMGAMGLKNPEGQKVQSASIFLSKLFRKYSTPNSIGLNDLRLNRLNGFFLKVSRNFPKEREALQVTQQMAISFIKNEDIMTRGDDFYPRITCTWISRILELIAESEFHDISIKLLRVILGQTKEQTLMAGDKFEQLVKSSPYFKDLQITKDEETDANQKGARKPFLTEFNFVAEIIANIKHTHLFGQLFEKEANKSDVMKLFLEYCQHTEVNCLVQDFIQIFISQKTHSTETVASILMGIDSTLFGEEDVQQILEAMIKEVSASNRKILYKVVAKGLTCQKRYHQMLLKSSSQGGMMDELAETFITEKNVNNYFLLFLMNKTNQKLSDRVLSLCFEQQKMCNREAIIVALWVVQNPNQIAYRILVDKFFDLEDKLTANQKICALKIIYLSLVKIPKSHFLTQIIKKIPSIQLDQQSLFEFLTFESNYEKVTLSSVKDQKRLGELLDRKFGASDEVYRLKVELHPVCGRTLPFMKQLKEVNEIFEKNLADVIQLLPTLSDKLLEVTLMGLNNRLHEQFLLGFENNQKSLDWALAQHRKQMKKFFTESEQELKAQNCPYLDHVTLELFQFNVLKGTDYSINQKFDCITNHTNIHRLEDLNFSEYYIGGNNDKTDQHKNLLRSKSIVLELRKYIKFICSGAKTSTKKDLKILLADDIAPLRAIKMIDDFSKIQKNKFKDLDKEKQLLRVAMKQLKPEFQFFDLMDARASSVGLDFLSFYECIPYLLDLIYPETIDFLDKLLKSKLPSSDDKKKKKKKVDQQTEKTEKQKLVAIILRRLPSIFGDPCILTSFKGLTGIISEISKACDPIELSSEISKWMKLLKIFHCSNFEQWKEKALNLVDLYEFICHLDLVFKNVSHTEIERHFMMLTDLLNTLYERYKKEEGLAEIEGQLLKGLYILYRTDCLKCMGELSMDEEEPAFIPRDKLNETLEDNHLDLLTDPHCHYCFDCSKTVCHNCVKIHRLHDISYTGAGNQKNCHRSQQDKDQKSNKRNNRKRDREQQRISYGNSREVLDSWHPRKSLEKYLSSGDRNMFQEEVLLMEHRLDMNEVLGDGRNLYESLRGRLISDLSEQRLISNNSKDEGEENRLDQENAYEIRSCSDKDFLIKSDALQESGCGKPVFSVREVLPKRRVSRLNLAPLYKLFVRELKSNSFVEGIEEKDMKDDLAFKAKVQTDKITMFKTDTFKNSGPRSQYPNQGFDLGGQPNNPTSKKNVLCIGDKFMILTSNSTAQLVSFNFEKFKHNFLIREGDRRSKDDTIEGKNPQRSKMSIAPVSQISFAPGMRGVVALVGLNRINFEFHHSDGKSQKFASTQNYSHSIQRFEWIKGVKGVFTFLSKQVNIMKLGKNEVDKKMRIVINRQIRDYGIVMHGYKLVYLTILDTSGKIYRDKIMFSENNPSGIDFSSKLVNKQYGGEKITSICCYTSFVIGAQRGGNLMLLNFNEDNTLVDEPFSIPIVEPLRKSQVAEQYPKCKQFTKITQMKVITRSESEIFMSCVLMKEGADESKEAGNFAIVSINIRHKKTNLMLMNDMGQTGTYDCTALNDKDYLFVGMQEDGEVWTYRFVSSRGPPPENEYKLLLSPNKIADFSKDVASLRILDQIDFYDPIRIPSFKMHPKLADKFKRVQDREKNTLKFQVDETKKYQYVVTGIEMGVVYPGNKTEPVELTFTFMDKDYSYTISRSREIQLSFTVKEALTLYFGIEPMEIKFTNKDDLVIKDETVYGMPWDEKSPFKDGIYNICKLVSIYMRLDREQPEQFFLNENKSCIGEFRYEQINKMIARKNYSKVESNLLMKLQFLRESIPDAPINDVDLSELYDSIRTNIMPVCMPKNELKKSVEKLCKKLSSLCSNSLCRQLAHPINYLTQFDIYTLYKSYEVFRNELTVESFENLIKFMNSLFNSRTINAYLILSISPSIVRDLTQFFRRILIDYKSYFKTNEYGLERDEKKRLFFLCQKLLRMQCQTYQLNKNKGVDKPEEHLLKTLESVFCINKKQFYRDVDLNPFIYFEHNFTQKTVNPKGVPIDLLKLEEVVLSDFAAKIKSDKPVNHVSSPVVVNPNEMLQPVIPQDPNSGMTEQALLNRQMTEAREEGSEGSSFFQQGSMEEEQHKMAEEENREMQEEYYLRKEQDDGNYQRMIDEDEEQDDEDLLMNQKDDHSSYQQFIVQNQSNLNKIYEYLKGFTYSQNAKPQGYELEFTYYGICENLLKEVFTNGGDYLTLDNSVFYVTLVYNLLTIVEKKLRTLAYGAQNIEYSVYNSEYVQGSVVPFIQAIDSAIERPSFSILFLGINHFIEPVPSTKNKCKKTNLLKCIALFYQRNCPNTKTTFSKCLSRNDWYPQKYKRESKLSSVIRLEYFDLVNPIYQLKYVGGLYEQICEANPQIADQIAPMELTQQSVLKAVVKYNLRVFKNIMVLRGWQENLESTKLDVAFEKLQDGNDSDITDGIKMVKQSIEKFPKIFVSSMQSHPERIEKIEQLLGQNLATDEELLQVLNAFYEASPES